MPVRRFRSIEEMSRPFWRTPGDPELYAAIRSVWDLGRRTSQRSLRPGVRRFRSIGEMSAARDGAASERR